MFLNFFPCLIISTQKFYTLLYVHNLIVRQSYAILSVTILFIFYFIFHFIGPYIIHFILYLRIAVQLMAGYHICHT